MIRREIESMNRAKYPCLLVVWSVRGRNKDCGRRIMIDYSAVITCPHCGYKKTEQMPSDT